MRPQLQSDRKGVPAFGQQHVPVSFESVTGEAQRLPELLL